MRGILNINKSDNTILYHSALKMSALRMGDQDGGREEEGEIRREGVMIPHRKLSRNAFPNAEASYSGMLLSLVPRSYSAPLFQQKEKVYWRTLVVRCMNGY